MEDKSVLVFRTTTSKTLNLVSRVEMRDTVVAMVFGKYDREDSTLVTVYKSGGMEIHMLRRQAELE